MLPPTMDEMASTTTADRLKERTNRLNWASNGMLAAATIAAASFVLHMIFNGRYGYFRDEFDYIICDGTWLGDTSIHRH